MQMHMIICPANRRGEVRNLITDHGAGRRVRALPVESIF